MAVDIYIYIYIYIIYLYIYIQINPAKNELGRISKTILDNINMKLFQATKINQWKNMVSAIKWFNSLKDKHLMKFVMFDIKDLYPSIRQDLWNKALNFASEYIYISKRDIDVINHARKSLLFDGSHTWIKKQGGLLMCQWGFMVELKCASLWAHIC